jgi:hypothetical protein
MRLVICAAAFALMVESGIACAQGLTPPTHIYGPNGQFEGTIHNGAMPGWWDYYKPDGSYGFKMHAQNGNLVIIPNDSYHQAFTSPPPEDTYAAPPADTEPYPLTWSNGVGGDDSGAAADAPSADDGSGAADDGDGGW